MSEFKTARVRLFLLLGLALSTLILTAAPALAESKGTAETSMPQNCTSNSPTTYPTAHISNGLVNAVVYLPDAKTGYYRGSRFDWSGVIGCLTYKGHNYFGVWFPHYDPYLHDAITGPVEEFRSEKGRAPL